jgi:hypothetical protein
MTDSSTVLKHFGLTRPGAALPPDDEEARSGSFGYLRGGRDRALNLEFRLDGGRSVSFPYSWLGPTRFDPSGGIALVFQGGDLFLVKLRGRNLNPAREEGVGLYDLLLRHRVVWVREVPSAKSRQRPESECVVDAIECGVVTPAQAASELGFR